MRRGAAALSVLAACLLATTPSAAAAGDAPPVPRGFHGVTLQEELTPGEVGRMSRGDVGSVRFMISWAAVEQTPGVYDWSTVDRTVTSIRAAGARPYPNVFATPAWLRRNPSRPPVGSARGELAWREFLTALVTRYGPGGVRDGSLPIRDWQLWNEPNLPAYWGSFPSPEGYGELLQLGGGAIHAVDPGARVVLAGLSPAGRGIKPWDFLETLYRQGFGDDFDVVALHPYGETLDDAEEQIRRARSVMRRAGDSAKPMSVTEIGWGSDGPRFHPLAGSPTSQAEMVRRSYAFLAENRRRWQLDSVYWYSWRDLPEEAEFCSFCTITGLLDADGTPKPAWRAFKRSARALRGAQRISGAAWASTEVEARYEPRVDEYYLDVRSGREDNDVTVAYRSGVYVISDSGPIESESCRKRTPRVVSCSTGARPRNLPISVELGDGDDSARIRNSTGYREMYIDGGAGADSIVGGRYADLIYGGPRDGDGGSRIRGRGGSDVIVGGQGDDLLLGGPGKDDIDAESGADRIHGMRGNDTLQASDGDREIAIFCGFGFDRVVVDGRDPPVRGCERTAQIAPGGGTK